MKKVTALYAGPIFGGTLIAYLPFIYDDFRFKNSIYKALCPKIWLIRKIPSWKIFGSTKNNSVVWGRIYVKQIGFFGSRSEFSLTVKASSFFKILNPRCSIFRRRRVRDFWSKCCASITEITKENLKFKIEFLKNLSDI